MTELKNLTDYIQQTCPCLAEFLHGLGGDVSAPLLADIAVSAAPIHAVGRIEDLLTSDAAEATREVLANQRAKPVFLMTIAGSRFLSSVLMRHPRLVKTIFLQDGYLVQKFREDYQRELLQRVTAIKKPEEFNRLLRIYKEEEYLRIGCRDLASLAGVETVMGELSDLAAACTSVALDFHWQRLVERHGYPPLSQGTKGVVVLGMGKISGRELNFSSDLDLVFLREPEEGRTSGPESVSVVRFYETLTRAVVKSLSEVTEDGFVLRVDLRLRPEGEKGELVPSVANALDYYLGWGRTWERGALMKATPIAGDIELGRSFLKELEPFIYRKYLDYSTLDDIRELKENIEAQLRRKPGINIKLGQGGIREIEFFVQTLQLINGGRTPRIRSASTLQALRLLTEEKLLEPHIADALREAYLFFRRTEHRIQINHQLQTHEVPRTPEEQEELARRMGYQENALSSFLADLQSHRTVVEEVFSSLLRQPGDESSPPISPLAHKIIQVIHDEPLVYPVLAEAGFRDPKASYRILRDLFDVPEHKIETERARRLLERLAPLFLEELLKTPNPSEALLMLDRYIDSLQATSTYFATFLEHPPTLRFLVRIFGESRFFTDLLVRSPQAIDSLIARAAQQTPRDKAHLEAELAQRLACCDDFEDELDTLRRFKHEEILRIGVTQFSGDLSSPEARRSVSDLAEVCLSAAVNIAVREMFRKFGSVTFFESVPLVIIGMGKLGGREMSYLSDLDVIFVYDPPARTVGKFSSHEWFTRLSSRIISILQVPTPEGIVFEIDTRLRPSGNKGPLVSSLQTFGEYHQRSSQLWERQALTKARVVTGPATLAREVESIVRRTLVTTRLTPEGLREIVRLRARMEYELGESDELHVDLKNGPGGLVDVEFCTQVMILRYAREHPEILCTNTLEALAAQRQAGLIAEHTWQILDSGYRFLVNLEDRLRIMEHRTVNRLPLKGEKLEELARRLGYPDGDALVKQYRSITRGIRTVFREQVG